MFPNGKVTMSDAEYTALMEHDAKQAATITEQRVRIARLEAALDRHGTFHGVAVALVRDMRLALLRGDYLMKQEMDARSDAWLKEVDGPRPTRSSQSDAEANTSGARSVGCVTTMGQREKTL